MAIRMARSCFYQDQDGTLLAGPGERVDGLTADEEATLVRTGSAYQIDPPADLPEDEKGE